MDKASLHTFVFRLAFSSGIKIWLFETPIVSVSLRLETFDVATRVSGSKRASSKCGSWYTERVILQFMCVGSWVGVIYLRHKVLMSPIKGETALHCCDPASPVLVKLESRNVFYVVSALQSIVCLLTKSVLELFSFILTAYLRGGSRIILRRGAPLRSGVTGRRGSFPVPSR